MVEAGVQGGEVRQETINPKVNITLQNSTINCIAIINRNCSQKEKH